MLRSLTFLQRRAPSSASSAVPFETRRLAVQSMGSQVDYGATSTNSSGHIAEKRNGISSRQYSYASKVLPTNQPTTARPILNQLTCTFSTHHVSSSHHRYSSSSPISSRDSEEELQAPIMQTGDGYLGKILNANVYDVAVETELQHAKNLSQVRLVCCSICQLMAEAVWSLVDVCLFIHLTTCSLFFLFHEMMTPTIYNQNNKTITSWIIHQHNKNHIHTGGILKTNNSYSTTPSSSKEKIPNQSSPSKSVELTIKWLLSHHPSSNLAASSLALPEITLRVWHCRRSGLDVGL